MKGWYQCQSVIFPMQFGLMTQTIPYRSITTGYSILHCAVGHVWWLFLGLLYWYPIILVKLLQHIWRLGTRKWNLRVPYLQMSCSDLVIATHLKVGYHLLQRWKIDQAFSSQQTPSIVLVGIIYGPQCLVKQCRFFMFSLNEPPSLVFDSERLFEYYLSWSQSVRPTQALTMMGKKTKKNPH